MLVEPRFVIPSRTTIARDTLGIYANLGEQLRDILWMKDIEFHLQLILGHRFKMLIICFWLHTLLIEIGNFIRVINFSQIENHKGETIGKEVEKYLKQWGIDRVLTLSIDNASSNDTTIDYMKKYFKHEFVLDGDFVHIRCCAHIFNLIVCDGLKNLNDTLIWIRNAVMFVRSSPARLAKFKKCIEEENISCKSMLCLNVQTRWNSTYLMLDAAESLKRHLRG